MRESITPVSNERREDVKVEGIGSLLWGCALEAAAKTILILVLGSVAIGLVGGLLNKMTPSTPPAIGGKAFPGTERLIPITSTFQKHRVATVFVLIFSLTTWARLKRDSGQTKQSAAQEISRRFSGNWFGVIVGNAFAALGIALAVYWLEQASFSRWVYGWFLGMVLPGVQTVGNYLLGKARVDTIGDCFTWYAQNQLKLNFWIIYLAAICDDLGIPNFKSLARWLWRRLRTRWTAPQLKPNTT
jgi:hypothetical protein